jgi:hypothetical protein
MGFSFGSFIFKGCFLFFLPFFFSLDRRAKTRKCFGLKKKKQLVRTADALLRATSIKRCLKTPERHKFVLTKQVINLKLDQITSE